MSELEEKLLSGAEAAEFLGVKTATLYAYASRGLIESMPSPSGGRERAYKVSELIKLRNSTRGVKSARDNEAPVWTGPLIKSSITEIRNEGHCYRGQPALTLARQSQPFELIAELLWETEESSLEPWTRLKPYPMPKYVKKLVNADFDYLDLLKLLIVSVEISDLLTSKLLTDEVFSASRRLIASMALAAGLSQSRESFITNGKFLIAQTLLFALCGSKSSEKAELVNAALVLCADHELNASALACRIAASCDASLFSSLLSALGTFSGTMHGAASRRAEDLVSASLKFKTVSAWFKDYMRHADKIAGFGSEIYESGDPRARFLIDTALELNSKNKMLQRLDEICRVTYEQLGAHPNLDIGLAAISYALALPAGSGSTIFAVSRTAGWIAHAIEQRMYGGVIRPRAKYIGKL